MKRLRVLALIMTSLVFAVVAASGQDWVNSSLDDAATKGFVAATEADGSPVYIIRAPFKGGVTVGKFSPRIRGAYVPWGGLENRVSTFELFVGKGEWQPMKGGDKVPDSAIIGGSEADGTPLFIIRGRVGAVLVPGKYHPTQQSAYVPWGGKEQTVNPFEILVRPSQVISTSSEWVATDVSDSASRASPAGRSPDGTPSFLIRAVFQGSLIPGKFNPKAKTAYVPWGGKENPVRTFELYIGPQLWFTPSPQTALPANAVPAGKEADGTPLYVIRSPSGSALVPGKYNARTKEAYIPIGGKEVTVTSFEYLVSATAPAPIAASPAAPPPAQAARETANPETAEPVEDREALGLWRFANWTSLLEHIEVRVAGGVLSATGALDDKDFSYNDKALDAYRLFLDDGATFSLAFSGVAKPADYKLFLFDSNGTVLGTPSISDQRIIISGKVEYEGPVYLFVMQNSVKYPGRYGLDLQQTSYSIEGYLEGDGFDQESIIKLALDPLYPLWEIEVGGDFDALFDVRDSKGKVIARSELVDDRVARVVFTPPSRELGDVRINVKLPTQQKYWKLWVHKGFGK